MAKHKFNLNLSHAPSRHLRLIWSKFILQHCFVDKPVDPKTQHTFGNVKNLNALRFMDMVHQTKRLLCNQCFIRN